VQTLGDAWNLRWHRVGQATKRDNLRGVLERQQRRHQALDVTPDARRAAAVDASSVRINRCRCESEYPTL
jgi:hypothetical protein